MNSESAFYILSILNGLLQLLCPRELFLLVVDGPYLQAHSSEENASYSCHYFLIIHSFLSFCKHKEFPLTHLFTFLSSTVHFTQTIRLQAARGLSWHLWRNTPHRVWGIWFCALHAFSRPVCFLLALHRMIQLDLLIKHMWHCLDKHFPVYTDHGSLVTMATIFHLLCLILTDTKILANIYIIRSLTRLTIIHHLCRVHLNQFRMSVQLV